MKFIVALLIALSTVNAGFFQMEKALVNENRHLLKSSRALETKSHEVIFAVKPKNLVSLEKVLMEVSTPKSSRYGKHLSRKEVADLTSNPEATAAIKAYLLANGAEIVKTTKYGEYITARGNIALWEKLFSTTFFDFQNRLDIAATPVTRSLDYSIDDSLVNYVEAVFQTSQLPPLMHSKIAPKKMTGVLAGSTVVPSLLNSYYNITSNKGNSLASQAVFETIGQYYSEDDLALFEKNYNLPAESIAVDIGGFESDTICAGDPNTCAEANLDVQYMIAISQGTPTTYWYEPAADSFLAWITAVADSDSPPLVNSISYGSTESALPKSLVNQFNTEAMKVGAMGISIFVSSGDDGAAGSGARGSPANCGYEPSFPATSPYITAVGATQGAESNSAEVVCSASTGGVITSGGGFSTKFAAPSYQTDAIANYLKTASPAPVSGFVTTGRGYPDLSLAGWNYQVVIGGATYSLSGTSASSPSVAAMVSLVNAARLTAGKSPLGFLNPAIYSEYASFTKDVTVGDNTCTASVVCCSQGFSAAPGWDPVTGFGSVNFGLMYNTLMNL